MKLQGTMSLHCGADPKVDKLLQLHDQHVQAIATKLKESGAVIKMVQDAQPFTDDKGKGYETSLYYGFTPAPIRRHVIRTYEDGNIKSWGEQLKEGLR